MCSLIGCNGNSKRADKERTLVLDAVNPLATKVQTRGGEEARILAIDLKSRSGGLPIVFARTLLDGTETVDFCRIDGHFFAGDGLTKGLTSNRDLVNAPVNRVLYVNIYKNSGGMHESRKQADKFSDSTRLACIRVEFEEGQLDD